MVLWIIHRHQPLVDPIAPIQMRSDILGLAAEIASLYGEIHPEENRFEPYQSASDGLSLQRESLLLRLRDLESGLRDRGTDSRICLDLESWMAGNLRQESSTDDHINGYLNDIHDWMLHLDKAEATTVDRLRIDPNSGPGLPVISFEAQGHPVELGRLLLSVPGRAGQWRLEEFDLIQTDSHHLWWMRGSFLYFDVEI